jgi:hypothetical protein
MNNIIVASSDIPQQNLRDFIAEVFITLEDVLHELSNEHPFDLIELVSKSSHYTGRNTSASIKFYTVIEYNFQTLKMQKKNAMCCS